MHRSQVLHDPRLETTRVSMYHQFIRLSTCSHHLVLLLDRRSVDLDDIDGVFRERAFDLQFDRSHSPCKLLLWLFSLHIAGRLGSLAALCGFDLIVFCF